MLCAFVNCAKTGINKTPPFLHFPIAKGGTKTIAHLPIAEGFSFRSSLDRSIYKCKLRSKNKKFNPNPD
jgi:hypothetical protein